MSPDELLVRLQAASVETLQQLQQALTTYIAARKQEDVQARQITRLEAAIEQLGEGGA